MVKGSAEVPPRVFKSLPACSGCGILPGMELTLVKATGPGDRDRAWLSEAGAGRRLAVHVVHDLPHLAVESEFGITDGLWAELAAGSHDEAGLAAAARDPKRHKQGRIVSGAAGLANTNGAFCGRQSAERTVGVPTDDWLTPGHRRAKAVTNCVTNRWGDGPDTPAGVRDRAARLPDPAVARLLGQLDDDAITRAIAGVRDLLSRWAQVPPGGTLRLTWPLSPDPADRAAG